MDLVLSDAAQRDLRECFLRQLHPAERVLCGRDTVRSPELPSVPDKHDCSQDLDCADQQPQQSQLGLSERFFPLRDPLHVVRGLRVLLPATLRADPAQFQGRRLDPGHRGEGKGSNQPVVSKIKENSLCG